MERRQFTKGIAALLAFPVRAIAATWDAGCACVRSGAHWTICKAKHWSKCSADEVKDHLIATHGHKPGELAHLSKNRALLVHDCHHEGGSYNDGRLSFSVPKPSAGRRI